LSFQHQILVCSFVFSSMLFWIRILYPSLFMCNLQPCLQVSSTWLPSICE
jgi:hypothetical protein